MKFKLLLISLIFLAFLPVNLYSQLVIDQGWGCSYGDNMIATDILQNGETFEYDMYIYFIRSIENKFTQSNGDYNTIPSSVFAHVWICNKKTNNFRNGELSFRKGPEGGAFTSYNKTFSNENKELWVFPNAIQISPYEAQNLIVNMTIREPDDTRPIAVRPSKDITFEGMSFPQYFIISEAPSTISVKSEQDFTVKVVNAQHQQRYALQLPVPDALNLYFYTFKAPSKENAFKTPVTFIPTSVGEPFTFVYPGKNVKADYEANYFDTGTGAAVVKSAKSYPMLFTFKEANLDLRCLVTFVEKSQVTYEFVP